MRFDKKKALAFGKLAGENAARFLFNLLFAYLYQILFGTENILAGVAVCVGITMLPYLDPHIKPLPMAFITIVLYVGAGVAAQFAAGPAWLGAIVNFGFTLLLLLLSAEPVNMRLSISFLLCFVFCQANPVPPERFGVRILGLFLGGCATALATVLVWRHKGAGTQGACGLQAQVARCAARRGFLLRAAFGLALGMFIAQVLGLKRPMWISIVVMSLTQPTLPESIQRVKHRALATVVGASVFIVLFTVLVPQKYAMLLIIAIGYVSFFTQKYKYTQIVNAICALNASAGILETSAAVENRVFCLAVGLAIVLGAWAAEGVVRKISHNLPTHPAKEPALPEAGPGTPAVPSGPTLGAGA